MQISAGSDGGSDGRPPRRVQSWTIARPARLAIHRAGGLNCGIEKSGDDSVFDRKSPLRGHGARFDSSAINRSYVG